ncbi:MAG: hypothetical protein Q9215_003691 [Flavoplaca cf. flavocitrina]
MPPPLTLLTRIINFLRPKLQSQDDPRQIKLISVGLFKLFCAGHLLTEYVGSMPGTYGPSMLPTLAAQNDVVYISKRFRYGKGVEVGDMVSFVHPCVPGAAALKRVVGMPGDFVMRDVHMEGNDTMLQVPEGHCWILGDNLTESRDSRTYGPIPLGLINGKVVAKRNFLFLFERLRNNLQRPTPAE